MPYEMMVDRYGVYKRFRGKVTYHEYAESQERVFCDPNVEHFRYVINDLLAVDSYSVSREQVEYLAALNRGPSVRNPGLQVAYVTTDIRAKALVEIARHISSFKLHIFPTLEETLRWAERLTPTPYLPHFGTANTETPRAA